MNGIDFIKNIIDQTKISSLNRFYRIRNSYVHHPNLIHPQAKVTNSKLYGKITVGEGSSIDNAFLMGGEISLGCYSAFNGPNSDIYCLLNPVRIGNFTSIARNVSIQEFNHSIKNASSSFILNHLFKEDMKNEIISKGPIIIDNDVWIGMHCCILSGAHIGNGSIIGANSVVVSDIPPFSIAAGSPAKVIKSRYSARMVKELEEIQWWNWDITTIKKNRKFFSGELTEEKFNQIVF